MAFNTVHAAAERIASLKDAGIDPYGPDDTAFDCQWVYCAQHVRAHPTGWCTVSNYDKFPLKATTAEEALNEVHALGYRITGEPWPCAACDSLVVESGDRLVTVDGRSSVCEARTGFNRHDHY